MTEPKPPRPRPPSAEVVVRAPHFKDGVDDSRLEAEDDDLDGQGGDKNFGVRRASIPSESDLDSRCVDVVVVGDVFPAIGTHFAEGDDDEDDDNDDDNDDEAAEAGVDAVDAGDGDALLLPPTAGGGGAPTAATAPPAASPPGRGGNRGPLTGPRRERGPPAAAAPLASATPVPVFPRSPEWKPLASPAAAPAASTTTTPVPAFPRSPPKWKPVEAVSPPVGGGGAPPLLPSAAEGRGRSAGRLSWSGVEAVDREAADTGGLEL